MLTVLFVAGACGGSEAEVDTTARGQARFQDAQTDHDGAPRQPAAPPEQPDDDPMRVEIAVEGTGDMSGLEPECTLDGATGGFEGLFAGEASVDEDGLFVAGLASGEAFFATASGCEIPELEITALTEVVVRGSLSATTQNCQSYCAAKARAHGEGECGAEPGSATCRAEAEAEYSGTCETRCTTESHEIVAETRLSVDAVAALSAGSLTGTALGEIEVDLTFDRLETADREVVDERP